MHALLRAFPPGADHPELALVRAAGDLDQGRLDEAAAHLAVAEAYAEAAPPDRRRRLRVAVGLLQLWLARRRGDLAGVIEHARFLASRVTGPSDEDIALGSDLRAVALVSLGTAEAWALGLPDAERHLREGADLAREIGRPYLEVAGLAQLGFAYIFHGAALPKTRSFAMTQVRCREAIALAERYGWGAEPVVAPALMTLAGTMVFLGEFDEAERWLRRTERALQTDTGPDIRLLLHQTAGMLHAGRGRHYEALGEFGAAEDLGSQLEGSQALASQLTGWLLATQARLGRPGEARALLAALDDERAGSGEIRNARAVICLAEGDPAGALAAVAGVLDGGAPVLGYVTVVEAHLLAGLAHRQLGDQRAASQAAERALALAEADRLILPFAMTGSAGLLEALPRHQTAHAALLADILDVAARLIPGGQRAVLVAVGGGAQPGRAAGAAVPADELVPARDRRAAVGLAEHRQRAYPQHLRQARCPGPILGRAAGPGAAAAGRWPDALAIPGTRRNASVRQRPRLLLNSLRLALSARRLEGGPKMGAWLVTQSAGAPRSPRSKCADFGRTVTMSSRPRGTGCREVPPGPEAGTGRPGDRERPGRRSAGRILPPVPAGGPNRCTRSAHLSGHGYCV